MSKLWLLLLVQLSLFVLSPTFARDVPDLLPNGGFEGGTGNHLPDWEPYESGFDIDRDVHHEGDQSIRCDSLGSGARRGAQAHIVLNQKRPVPILVTGWSKADRVDGVKNGDYAIYIDLEYTDGTPLWGLTAPYSVGTHDWERRQILVLPAKPIKSMIVYPLFRNHVGTVWFDDFHAHTLSGANLFDSQPLPPQPKRAASVRAHRLTAEDGLSLDLAANGEIVGTRLGQQDVTSSAFGGFYVRDVAADGPLIPMRGSVVANKDKGFTIGCASGALHLKFAAKILPKGDTLAVDGEITDTTRIDRAVTVYFVLPVQAEGWTWGHDIRRAEPIESNREFTNQVRVSVGATGGISQYPFGCVSGGQNGVGIASQMDWPSVYRIFYNGPNRQLVMAWDFGLTKKTAAWPSSNARFRCTLFRLPPGQAAWGFRAAAQRFYRLNAAGYERRAKAEGIWIPFTDPSIVQNVGDFGIAYHEGDNSIKSDDALGILSFRYTEPMSYWMPMPPSMPRTYEEAIGLLHRNAEGQAKDATARDFSRAVLSSGTQEPNGRFNLEFRNEPWANGAVFVLNPNPELPVLPDKPTKGWLNYNLKMAESMYSEAAQKTRGIQDGEYLDSLESWADYQDYRPSDLQAIPYPIPFDTDSRRPTIPQWFATHTFSRFLSNDLHNRGKLLMANTTPVRFAIYATLMDVMGIEVNWLDGNGNWEPDNDETMSMRRTLSFRKPYLLLQNTDFNKFTLDMAEKYFLHCLFYSIYPSFFSVNAADNPYWDNPKWYNRDRPLFKKYIPIIKRLSSTGWEPITHAHSTNPAVYVERYGTHLFSVLNDSRTQQTSTLSIDLRALGLPAGDARVISLISGAEVPARITGTTLTVSLTLKADTADALELK